MKVVKRDGTIVTFNADKIEKAIASGFGQYHEAEKTLSVLNNVLKTIELRGVTTIEIEQIQDIVEESFVDLGYVDAYKRFKTYRHRRAMARQCFTSNQHKLMKTLENFGIKEASSNDEKRENANINGDTAMGMMLKYGSTLSKAYTTSYLLPKKYANAHSCGDIHIHDLDFYAMGTTTCLQIDLERLFSTGFNTGHGFLRQPQSIQSYASLCAIIIQSNQNDQHGGQSIPCFDYYLAKGVLLSFKKIYKAIVSDFQEYTSTYKQDEFDAIMTSIDELTDCFKVANTDKLIDKVFKQCERETYQAMEGLIANLNTMHSRAGAQVPFSSINFGTDVTEAGRMVSKQLLLAMENGLGKHETAIFPILIFKVKEGINYFPTDKNYDLFQLAMRCSAKRMFPNFAFLDAPFNREFYREGDKDSEIAYMGCRTRVIANPACGNNVVTRRGNLSFTTINLVRIALKHGLLQEKVDMDGFYKELGEKCDLVCEQLYDRYRSQAMKKVKNFPFLMAQGNWRGSESLTSEDTLEEVLKQGTLTIGFIGLAECLVALFGKHHGECLKSQQEGLEIIGFMRKKIDEYCIAKGMNYSLIATPAEGLSGRFTKLDKEQFGVIERITDRLYYTNSFHVPVHYPISIKNKMMIEGPYHALCNGGHISYVEINGEMVNNLSAFEKCVTIMKESGVGYGAINHPIDRDPVCGYNGLIFDECPQCHRQEEDIPFERIRRITGYLVGTLDRFNDGKKAEEKDRIKHGN